MTLPMNTEIATIISENIGGVVAYCVCCSGVYEEGSREGARGVAGGMGVIGITLGVGCLLPLAGGIWFFWLLVEYPVTLLLTLRCFAIDSAGVWGSVTVVMESKV